MMFFALSVVMPCKAFCFVIFVSYRAMFPNYRHLRNMAKFKMYAILSSASMPVLFAVARELNKLT